MCNAYFLKTKAFEKFKQFKNLAENQLNMKIKILRSDNGREFCSKSFEQYLRDSGKVHQTSNSYTPQQNVMAERFNRTIVEKARCLLLDGGLSKCWAEACNAACYLKNRSASSNILKTPYELWTGKKPSVSYLRVYGSIMMVHIPKVNRNKFDEKSTKHFLVGYDETRKGYRCFNPVTVIETTKTLFSHAMLQDDNRNEAETDIKVSLDDSDSVGEVEQLLSGKTSSVSDLEETLRRSQRQVKAKKFEDYVTYFNGVENCDNEGVEMDLPETVKQALARPDGEMWKKAMQDEIQSFNENETWELVDPPPAVSTIVEVKNDSECRYRARLVAKGYTQKEGVDYTETFAPVVRHSTFRLLLGLAVKLKLGIWHLDVKTAFLNGVLEENVFMTQPEGFVVVGCMNKVYKLKKAVYGLKQSRRAWNKKVDEVLSDIGYKKSEFEPCLYIKRNNCDELTIIALYVDDFFCFSDSKEINFLVDHLSSQFKIKNLGEAKHCLGVRIKRDYVNNFVAIDQEMYIDHLLKRFRMLDSKIVNTPLDSSICLSKIEGESCDPDTPYQELIGCLMYLAVMTRPDIAHAVSLLSQYNKSYTKLHWQTAKRLLRYLKGTRHF